MMTADLEDILQSIRTLTRALNMDTDVDAQYVHLPSPTSVLKTVLRRLKLLLKVDIKNLFLPFMQLPTSFLFLLLCISLLCLCRPHTIR